MRVKEKYIEVKDYFIKQLNSSNSGMSKDDLIRCAQECGIEIKNKHMALSKIIDKIVEEGFYDKLYEYFNADTYAISVLDYDKEQLEVAYNNAYGGDMYSLRLETQTEEEVKKLISLLNKIFKVESIPQSYSHRNERGYYTYIKVKPLNNTKEEENRLLNKIQQLENEKKKMEEMHQEKIQQIYNILGKYLGEDVSFFNLTTKLHKLKKGIENKDNTRGAGRKPKFSNDEIAKMKEMKEKGLKYEDIAKEYNTSKVTVIKYLKHKKV